LIGEERGTAGCLPDVGVEHVLCAHAIDNVLLGSIAVDEVVATDEEFVELGTIRESLDTA